MKTIDKLKEKIDVWKRAWIPIVSFVVFVSLAALFLLSFNNKENIVLQDINNWISLILGFVATILSVISLLLSFYNYDKSIELNEENTRRAEKLLSEIEKRLTELPGKISEEVKKNTTYFSEVPESKKVNLKKTE